MGSGQDYSSVGGALKLKGSVGITKTKHKKKKKKKKAVPDNPNASDVGDPASGEAHETEPRDNDEATSDSEITTSGKGWTESERKFDEARRKRLDQKLLKDSRSHKERVDAFNKYLANLSEHHDMPRIGPG